MSTYEPPMDDALGAMPGPTPQTVTEEQPTPQQVEAVEAFNLVPLLMDEKDGDPEWLEKEASRVVQRCKEHEEQRDEFMKRRANQLKLLTGMLDKLKFPAEGAQAPHLPLLLQAMLAHWSRIWDQVFPAKGDYVHLSATSFEDEERERRVEKHFNWQLRTKIPEWVSSHADSIMQWLLSGSTFRDYVWDPVEECCRIDHVPIDDMVIPYTSKDSHPLMPDVAFKTRIRRLARHKLEQLEKVGYYVNVSELYADGAKVPPTVDDASKVREMSDKVDGIERPDSVSISPEMRPDAEREILEQHYWCLLPGEEQMQPIKFCVDRATKKPLSITIREMEDSVDRARFDLETREAQAAAASMAQQQQMAIPGQPVQPTAAPPAPKPVKTRTLHTIVHYRLFPNPEGFYGLGAGFLLEGPNDLVDKLLGDLMVSGKLQNVQAGFISERARGKKGDVEFVPGKFHALDCEPEDMDKAVKPFQFGPPSQTLMEIAKWLNEEAKSQTANADTLAGEQGTSRETAASVNIRNSNATQVVNVMTRLYLVPLQYEIGLIAHGNSIYLGDQEYFAVVEPSKETPGDKKVFKGKAGRADYLEDYDIGFTADSRMSSKPERITTAFGLMDRMQQSPVMKDPQRGQMLSYLMAKGIFEAMERPDMIAGLGQPPMPPPPPSPQSQETENAGFLNEADHPVLPDDNHMVHMQGLNDFEKTPHFGYLSPTGKQMFDRHRRAHVAAIYQQQGAGNGAPTGMGGQPPGPGGFPPGPNHAPGPGSAPGAAAQAAAQGR